MFEKIISNPMVVLAVSALALLVALGALYMVQFVALPRIEACELAASEPGAASAPPAHVAADTLAPKASAPPSLPAAAKKVRVDSIMADRDSSADRAVPQPRRRGGISGPGKTTRRSRVQVSEFTPETATQTSADAEPGQAVGPGRNRQPTLLQGGPDKVSVRRIEKTKKAGASKPASQEDA